jgi:adenosylmethionine-8-amino-7-oxononanoate aminotransferase
MSLRPNSTQARDVAYVLHPYTNAHAHQSAGPLVISRGEGAHVYDDQGNRYIEALSGLFCASLGFSEERLVEAATRQMRTLPFYHSFGHKTNEPGVELAERLIALAPTPMSKVFFANSGSEANDTAIKLVWYYHNAIGKPEKKKIISHIRAYHGVTVATASLTGLASNHRDFDLPIARILHTDCPSYYRYGARGVGLVGVLELVEDKASRGSFDPAAGVAAQAGARAQAHGVITRCIGDYVNLCPPPIITESQIEYLMERIRMALDDTLQWVRSGRP